MKKVLLLIVIIVISQIPAFSQVYVSYSPAVNIIAPGGDRYQAVKPGWGSILRLDIKGKSGRWLVGYERQGMKWREAQQPVFSYHANDFISLNYSLDFIEGLYFAPGVTLNLRDKPSDLGVSAIAGWRYNLSWFYVAPEARYIRLLDDRIDLFTFSVGVGFKLFNTF